MNKTIISTVVATMLLTSSLVASSCPNGKTQGCESKKENCGMMKGNASHKKEGSLFRMVQMLDLTQEQEQKVQDIIKGSQEKMPKSSEAFSQNGFDKKKYIEIQNSKRELRVQSKAEAIEKIYTVLNEKQKADLKMMLTLKESMREKMKNKMKKGNCNDKNCNGRG